MITIIIEFNVDAALSNQGSVWILPRQYTEEDMEEGSMSDVLDCERLYGPIHIDECDRMASVLVKSLREARIETKVENICDD